MGYRWIIKAAVQKTISFMPGSSSLNYFFQKYVTRGVRLTDPHFRLKLRHAADHLRAFRDFGHPGPDRQILELGTGWYPVVPLVLFLGGAGVVTSVDIRSWMNRDTLALTLERLLQWRNRGDREEWISWTDPARWDILEEVYRQRKNMEFGEMKRHLGITTVVGDARSMDFADHSVDFICSNNTFEHIPAAVLKGILGEFGRILAKQGGVMNHFIDMSDHFAHFDPTITIYNFLKFSRKSWKILDNRIQPQNRLRLKDYLNIYREVGIPVTRTLITGSEPEALARVRVHPEFSGYSSEELSVSHAYLVTVSQEKAP